MEIKIKAEHQAASDAAVAHTGMDEQSYWQAYVDARGAEMTAALNLTKSANLREKIDAAISLKGIAEVEAAIDAVTAAAVEEPKP